ncbi:ligase-associated DNA damage response endonuclease PdeM [Sphingobium sp. H39-3-25]|uniref:ligase-associated DNA damage response endonuclease PdeM n=1 Tax=Sphingobium arseniciresistens TaxID=3030834 RepID=UPI0023B92E17|nr:ligase-associated DNA damage response endonuclease PdeM [Sphingobium arseniciresistens]
MVPLSFGQHEFLAYGQAALFWPARRALLLADLHFEKASWFARLGQHLPPYDSRATLDAVVALVEQTGAGELWCLGDSFHDMAGAARMDAETRGRLRGLTDRLDWHWITGNHDIGLQQGGLHDREISPDAQAMIGGTVLPEAVVEGIVLRHEADPAETRPEISGHFHPKLRLSLRGRHVSRRCFVRTPRKLLMPAFGALTGGLDAGAPAIRDATGAGVGALVEALVPVESRLLRFPLTPRC